MGVQSGISRKIKPAYSKRRKRSSEIKTGGLGIITHVSPEKIGYIQGKYPGSVEEWRVAKAHWKWGIRFDYQVPIKGGKIFRGGQVVDFVSVLPPIRQPVQVFGEHWHISELDPEERFLLEEIAEIYNIYPIVLWGLELQNQNQANQTFYDKVIAGLS